MSPAETGVEKHYFKKDGLLDLEKIEQKLANIIEYKKPNSRSELETLIRTYLNNNLK